MTGKQDRKNVYVPPLDEALKDLIGVSRVEHMKTRETKQACLRMRKMRDLRTATHPMARLAIAVFGEDMEKQEKTVKQLKG